MNYGGIKCYPVYWVRTRGRVVAGSKYYLNKNKNKVAGSKCYLNKKNKKPFRTPICQKKISNIYNYPKMHIKKLNKREVFIFRSSSSII